jgi:hypothetical protein
MSIVEFFDINNHEHVSAWIYLEDHAVWPKGFLPTDIYFPPGWGPSITYRLARKYAEEFVGTTK